MLGDGALQGVAHFVGGKALQGAGEDVQHFRGKLRRGAAGKGARFGLHKFLDFLDVRPGQFGEGDLAADLLGDALERRGKYDEFAGVSAAEIKIAEAPADFRALLDRGVEILQ